MAESLGKSDSSKQSFGLLPVVNKGTIDQHSQLQLYLGGSEKYMFTLLKPNYGTITTKQMKNILSSDKMSMYEGLTANKLIDAHYQNTVQVLKDKGHYVREMTLSNLSEKTFGAFMMQSILEVLSLSIIWGINAFDQPAVEDSKRHMEKYL